MKLSIIIVNYRSADLISQCIQSALQFPSATDFEWIIADNNSNDNSADLISSRFPFVRFIQMGYNAGFARANNAGIKASKSDTVLLLNPDTIIVEDAINCCFESFQKSNAVAASAQLLNADGSPQITGNYFIKGSLNQLLPLPYLGKLLRAIAFAAKVKKTNLPVAQKTEQVDWINGAFMMVKKSAIEKAGLLDEDFFLYSEEIEWCSRLKKIGTIEVYADYHVIHLQGETINASTQTTEKGYQNLFNKKGLQLMVSNHLRIRKQYGVIWFLIHLFIHTFEIPVFIICKLIDNIVHIKNPFKEFTLVAGYTANVFKLWGWSFRILFNKHILYKVL